MNSSPPLQFYGNPWLRVRHITKRMCKVYCVQRIDVLREIKWMEHRLLYDYTNIYKKGLRYEITQRNMLQLLLRMAAKCGIVVGASSWKKPESSKLHCNVWHSTPVNPSQGWFDNIKSHMYLRYRQIYKQKFCLVKLLFIVSHINLVASNPSTFWSTLWFHLKDTFHKKNPHTPQGIVCILAQSKTRIRHTWG